MTQLISIRKNGPVVAIDGPAGTGKSSATRRLADALGYVHVDTGALYRAIAWLCLDAGELAPEDVEKGASGLDEQTLQTIVARARSAKLEFRRMPRKNPKNRVYVNGKDVTDRIRSAEVSMLASLVSAIPGVRSALGGLQRGLGCAGPSILEGRDIGTVIFPDADVKFFLTASVDERAKRRLAEIEARGEDVPSFEEVRRQIAQRDAGDSSRAVAPLRKAEDAIEIDTTEMTLDEVVTEMERVIRSRVHEASQKTSERRR